jgi:cell division protein FtsL
MVKARRNQAFRQAPWRLQIRTTGETLLWLTAMLVVGGMYLAVSAKVAQAGRQVLSLESQRSELLRQRNELSARLAELTSPEQMLPRAAELGFKPAGPDVIIYVTVEGYAPQAPFIAPRPPASPDPGQGDLSPAYTETLGQWFTRWLSGAGG